ncbi:hypothetical protein M885DRAFT_501003 [Pelagophyceae sp. CCMP2097]|nr:hypothetical protein M885DRAFT_501003 [Pelagophyceae sp. CCMP2097]
MVRRSVAWLVFAAWPTWVGDEGSCFDSAFGSPRRTGIGGEAEGPEYWLTKAMCARARTVVGNGDALVKFSQRLKECSHALVVVATKHNVDALCPHKNGLYECKSEAWPARLESLLIARRLKYCASGAAVVVQNLCKSSTGTEYANNMVVGGDWDAQLTHADLIIVETATNDVQFENWRLGLVPEKAVLEQTEILARLLTSIPTKPALLWLGTAWRNFGVEATPPYHTCSADAHRSVLRYYDIPQLQMFEAFQPVHSVEARWIRQVYYNDCCHPSNLGHKMIASVVGFALDRGAEPMARSWLETLEAHPPPPLFIDERTAAIYFSRHASFTLNLRQPTTGASSEYGFTWYEDVPTKPGFIANAVGATTLIRLAVDAGRTQQRLFSLSLGYLVSHGGSMGAFAATISCAEGTLASVKGDGEEPKGAVSIYRSLVLRGVLNCRPNATLWLNVTVVPSEPPRGRNKVKLYDLTLVII